MVSYGMVCCSKLKSFRALEEPTIKVCMYVERFCLNSLSLFLSFSKPKLSFNSV